MNNNINNEKQEVNGKGKKVKKKKVINPSNVFNDILLLIIFGIFATAGYYYNQNMLLAEEKALKELEQQQTPDKEESDELLSDGEVEGSVPDDQNADCIEKDLNSNAFDSVSDGETLYNFNYDSSSWYTQSPTPNLEVGDLVDVYVYYTTGAGNKYISKYVTGTKIYAVRDKNQNDTYLCDFNGVVNILITAFSDEMYANLNKMSSSTRFQFYVQTSGEEYEYDESYTMIDSSKMSAYLG
ncbi:MAG: hypothetical protein R3Y13_01090 [bacterium]